MLETRGRLLRLSFINHCQPPETVRNIHSYLSSFLNVNIFSLILQRPAIIHIYLFPWFSKINKVVTLSEYSYPGLFYKVHSANIDSGHTENLIGKKKRQTNLITLPLVAVFVYLFEILIFVRPPNPADPHCSFEKHNSLMYYSLMHNYWDKERLFKIPHTDYWISSKWHFW